MSVCIKKELQRKSKKSAQTIEKNIGKTTENLLKKKENRQIVLY